MAVLGAENKAGDFEVLDICFPGLAPQPALPPLPPHPSSKVTTTTASTSKDAQSKDVEMNSEGKNEGEWIALLSGLEMGGGSDEVDLRIQLMAEWLVGELGDEDVRSLPFSFHIPCFPLRDAFYSTRRFDHRLVEFVLT